MHNGYRGTLGARGCGKQRSYEVTCAHGGYVHGKHEIACTSQANAAPAQP
jgi:hypothetical protein